MKFTKLALLLALLPAVAFAQQRPLPPPPPPPEDAAPPEAPPGTVAQPGATAQPDSPQPGTPPPPPPKYRAAPTGQWVYTAQYGWVWMPHDTRFVDQDTDEPYEYVYRVRVGWGWVIAPWVWGYGVYPYFGVWGPARFGWYAGWHRHWYAWRPYTISRPWGYWRHGPARFYRPGGGHFRRHGRR